MLYDFLIIVDSIRHSTEMILIGHNYHEERNLHTQVDNFRPVLAISSLKWKCLWLTVYGIRKSFPPIRIQDFFDTSIVPPGQNSRTYRSGKKIELF